MLKAMRKQKKLLFFLTTFSILFGGLFVGGPVLAGDDQQESLGRGIQEIQENPPSESLDPDETTTSGQDEDDDDDIDDDDGTEDDEDNDDDNDGVDDDDEERLSRKVKVDQEDKKVKIESELKADDRKDEFKVELQGEEDLRIKYEYESEAGSVESDIELEVRFIQIIEYIDTDSDGVNETDIEHSVLLEDFSFTLDTVVTSDTTLYEINATYTFDNDGYFRVRVFASENFTLIDGQPVAPSTIKFDIEIFNFPYTVEGSQLGLDTKVEVETSASVDYLEVDGNLIGLSSTIDNYTAEFTWIDTVLVDEGKETVDAFIYDTDIISEDDEDKVELKLYLLYPRGEHITHDPQIGTPLKSLSYAQDIQVSLTTPTVPETGSQFLSSLMLVLLVFMVPAFLRRRK